MKSELKNCKEGCQIKIVTEPSTHTQTFFSENFLENVTQLNVINTLPLTVQIGLIIFNSMTHFDCNITVVYCFNF